MSTDFPKVFPTPVNWSLPADGERIIWLVAHHVGTEVHAGSPRLDRVEGLGFIARERNPEDRHGKMVVLTDKGRRVIDKAITAHVEKETTVLASLTRKEQETLNRLLAKLIAGLGEINA